MNTFITQIVRRFVLGSIRVYQKTLSLDHSPFRHLFPYGYCRFNPTCSEYAYQAIDRHGLIKGGWQAFKRLLRCHPWSAGGNDPVL